MSQGLGHIQRLQSWPYRHRGYLICHFCQNFIFPKNSGTPSLIRHYYGSRYRSIKIWWIISASFFRFIFKNEKSKLITCLKYALRLSYNNTSCLVFNFFIYLTDTELIFIAKRYHFLLTTVHNLYVNIIILSIYFWWFVL